MPSKVGIAAEQPSARPNQQKAITIQDLKKQTAIRLQQEHQQNQIMPSDPRTCRPVVTPQTLAARRKAHASVGYHGTAQPINPEVPPVNHYQRLHHSAQVVHHIPSVVDAYGGAPQYYDHTHKNPRNRGTKYKHGSMPAAPQHLAPTGSGTTGGRYNPDQRSQHLRTAPPPAVLENPMPPSSSSAYNTASSNQGGPSTASSKLPHGLTVHELKEMTKARLQAEAAETMPGDENPNRNGISMATEGGTSSPFNGAPANSFQPVPLQMQPLQSQSMLPEQNSCYRQPAEVSPPSRAFHSHHHQSTPSPYDNSSHDPNRMLGNQYRADSYTESNWENASVTSHNSTVASDYLGSESAFSSGVGGGFSQAGDDQSGLSLNRTQSYPVPSRESTPTSLPSPLASSYFDSSAAAAAMASNRQRAMTLSPRPGLSLLHEDRPGFSDDALGIPSFSSSSRQARQQLPTRSRRSFSPIMQSQGYASDSFAGGYGSNTAGVFGVVYENRPRTSSAVSLPTISHTAEEFALDGYYGGTMRSSDGVNIGGAPIQEHDALSLTGAGESLMSSSSLYGSGDMRSTSSVFRDEYGSISAPPGLGSSDGAVTGSFMNPLMARTGSMDGNGSDNNRVRASTWVAGGDVFGTSSSLYESTVDDTLAGDLASILKLSGAEEKDDTFPGKPNDFGESLY